MSTTSFRKSSLFRYIAFTVLAAFLGLLPVQPSWAQVSISMPPVGQMVHITNHFEPPQMVGLKINLKDPFSFGFIMDQGQSPMSDSVKKDEYNKIIKYFLVSLAMPNKDMWVNLSPFESKRIVPEIFGQTEMGRDLLAQDYILKQFTASLMYPDDGLGKKFWSKVYEEGQARFGTTDINVNTFNKVWIVADHADVYQKGDTAFLVGSHLKVMLEQDFKAIEQNREQFGEVNPQDNNSSDAKTQMASQLVREIIIPAIEKEVNEGQSFAAVRQIYNAEIMATWFKKTLKESLLGQVFADKSRVAGQRVSDPQAKEKIFQQYLLAYKRGVFNFIKQEATPDGQMIPRRYLSGGMKNIPMVGQGTVNNITPEQVTLPTPTERAAQVQVLTTQLGQAQAQGQENFQALLEKQFGTSGINNSTPRDVARAVSQAPVSPEISNNFLARVVINLTQPNATAPERETQSQALTDQLNKAQAQGPEAYQGALDNLFANPGISSTPIAPAMARAITEMPQMANTPTAALLVDHILTQPKAEVAQEVKSTGEDLAMKAANKTVDLAQVSLAPATQQAPVSMTPEAMVRTMAETPGVSQAALVSSISNLVGQLTKATDNERQQLAAQLSQAQGTDAILAAVANHFTANPAVAINTPVAPEVAMPMIKEVEATPASPQVDQADIGKITDRLTSQVTATPNMTPEAMVRAMAETPGVSQAALVSSISNLVGQLTKATDNERQQLAAQLSQAQGTDAILAAVANHFTANPAVAINTPVAPEVAMPMVKAVAAEAVTPPQANQADIGKITDRLTSQVTATPNMTPEAMVRTMAETPGVSQAALVSSISNLVGQLTKATDNERQQLAAQLSQAQGTDAILAAVANHFTANPAVAINTPVAPEVAMPMIKEVEATPASPQVDQADIGKITDRLTSQVTATPNMTPEAMVRAMAETPGVSQAALVSSISNLVGQLTKATDNERQQLAAQLSQAQGTDAILAAVANHFTANPAVAINTPVAPEVAMPMVKAVAAEAVTPPQANQADIGKIADRLTNQINLISSSPQTVKPNDLGGINLSNEHLTLNVKVDGAGMPLPPQDQDKAMMNLNGLVSIIRSITPITQQNSPALYELAK